MGAKEIFSKLAKRICKKFNLAPAQFDAVCAILGAGLMTNLAAGRIEKILERPEVLGLVAQSIGLVVVAVLGIALGARAFREVMWHRLVTNPRGAEPIDALILPVSWPKRGEQSAFHEDAGGLLDKVKELAARGAIAGEKVYLGDELLDLARHDLLSSFARPILRIGDRRGKDEPRNEFSVFSWTTGFKTADFFLNASEGRLRAIHLLPSEGAADAEGTENYAKNYYGPILAALLERRTTCEVSLFKEEEWISAAPNTPCVVLRRAVDYDDFEEVQKKIRAIVELERKRHERARLAIDVTGGSSAFSAAAAIESTQEDVVYCYVGERKDGTLKDPKPYNVVAERFAP